MLFSRTYLFTEVDTYLPSLLFSDALYKDEVMNLVSANRGKSRLDLAALLRHHLQRTYPSQYWVVTVYDPVGGLDNHAFTGYTSRVG